MIPPPAQEAMAMARPTLPGSLIKEEEFEGFAGLMGLNVDGSVKEKKKPEAAVINNPPPPVDQFSSSEEYESEEEGDDPFSAPVDILAISSQQLGAPESNEIAA
eukprot:CAMPEP_0170496268 /NCGR_PEP_ID=MMETSP0208-20121228/20795_1 /TAXON_ID=197538 /ORGANISM="Strombidium inclinatum, Strain S3" /LENGTH=103 /DNA_ID=CAMNT_0010772765 /DNA_START=231 /DNA_END=542 /DNA_ORIENTATION=+